MRMEDDEQFGLNEKCWSTEASDEEMEKNVKKTEDEDKEREREKRALREKGENGARCYLD